MKTDENFFLSAEGSSQTVHKWMSVNTSKGSSVCYIEGSFIWWVPRSFSFQANSSIDIRVQLREVDEGAYHSLYVAIYFALNKLSILYYFLVIWSDVCLLFRKL